MQCVGSVVMVGVRPLLCNAVQASCGTKEHGPWGPVVLGAKLSSGSSE